MNFKEKKQACIESAKFYIQIAHVYAAIRKTLNPEYRYRDENGKLQMKGKVVLGDDPNTDREERSWLDGFKCFDEDGNKLTKENCPLQVLDKLMNY